MCPTVSPPITVSRSTSCSTIIVVSVIVVSMVTALVGFFLGLLVMWCWNRRRQKTKDISGHVQQMKPLSLATPGPLYDVVQTPQGDQNIKVDTNEAYGYIH